MGKGNPPQGACWGCAPHTLPSAEGRGGEAGAGSRSPPGAARPRSARCFPTGGEESPAPGAGSPLRERGRRSGWGAVCVGRGREEEGKAAPGEPRGCAAERGFPCGLAAGGRAAPGAAALARLGPAGCEHRAARREPRSCGLQSSGCCAPGALARSKGWGGGGGGGRDPAAVRPEFLLPSPKSARGSRDGIAGAGGGGMGGIALGRP